MARTKRLYRVVATWPTHTSTRHYQTSEAAQYKAIRWCNALTRPPDKVEIFRSEPIVFDEVFYTRVDRQLAEEGSDG